jgi:hypothetical protein
MAEIEAEDYKKSTERPIELTRVFTRSSLGCEARE